jgi:hypothetical protein
MRKFCAMFQIPARTEPAKHVGNKRAGQGTAQRAGTALGFVEAAKDADGLPLLMQRRDD